MKQFSGNVLFLDRSDINTDEIIPAKYLTESTKIALKPYAFEDLKLDGFDVKKDMADKTVVITRANFGCGSSREHAPWALEVNGINIVIAESFARIFRQNMYNCGLLAIELPGDKIDGIFKKYKGKKSKVTVDIKENSIVVESEGIKENFAFSISGFDKALIETGGWVDYADKHY